MQFWITYLLLWPVVESVWICLEGIMLTREEVEKHSTKESCWVAIHGFVYDVTGISPLCKSLKLH